MKFILAKKIEMTQIWTSDDVVVAATKVEAGPCFISQLKSKDNDGYTAVQVAFGKKKEKNIKKPQIGHLKKLKSSGNTSKMNFRYMREFRVDNTANLNIGDMVTVATFNEGDIVDVCGISKGCGFQGVVKRHGFSGSKMTHGNKDQQRMPGSIGATGPAHVFKGTRMGGQMGNVQVTDKNLKIIKIDTENNILYIKGAVPGHRNGLLLISGEGELKISENMKHETEYIKPEIEEVNKQVTEATDNSGQKTEDKVIENKEAEIAVEEAVAEETKVESPEPEPIARESKEEEVVNEEKK